MSNNWSNRLKQTLLRLKTNKSPRVAVMGIGHELLGDDAAGVMVARALKPALVNQQDILIIDGGQAPENQTGAIRRFSPDFVLLIDAAQLGEPIGMARWIAWQEIDGLSASTHTLPLDILAQYLHTELGCEVALIGIQPAPLRIGSELSPPVKQTVAQIILTLTTLLKH